MSTHSAASGLTMERGQGSKSKQTPILALEVSSSFLA